MINLFFSYSYKDESLRNELEIHLAMLKREGTIQAWHDRRILAGDEFNVENSGQFGHPFRVISDTEYGLIRTAIPVSFRTVLRSKPE